MKPNAFLPQLFLLTFGIINSTAQEPKQVDILFARNEFNIISDDENTYSIESLSPDLYYPEDPSLPAIPLKSIWVLVPNGAELIDYEFETEEDIVSTDIVLTRSPLLVATNTEDPGEYSVREFKGIFPRKPVRFNTVMVQRGITYFSFTVSPFRYEGSRQELTFIGKIKLKVHYRINQEKTSVIRQDNTQIPRLKEKLANPDDFDRFYAPSTGSLLKSAKEKVDYLIVTTEKFKPEFSPLLEWKMRKGLSVDIVTIEEIDDQYTDASIQLKIKRCLQDYYQNNDLRWVLLAGDYDIVPVQPCYDEINSGSLRLNDNSIPADLFYACFDKRFDWNSWLNDKIGQRYADDVDLIPEIYISRIPVRTSEQVNTFVSKTVDYETGHLQAAYNGKMLMAGVKLCTSWDGKSDSHHRSDILYNTSVSGKFDGEKTGFFDTGTDFPDGDAYQVTRSNLAFQINNGYGIIHFTGHGNKWGIQMEAGNCFTTQDASELSNPPAGIFLSTSCEAGRFDAADPCLAEAFLNNPDGGCVAFFGSSRIGISTQKKSNVLGPSLNFNASFLKYLLEEKTGPGSNSFAAIASRAKPTSEGVKIPHWE